MQAIDQPPTPIHAPVMQSEVIGAGAPLVLIGGGLTGMASWKPAAERLATSRQVARLQLLSVQYGLEDRPLGADYSLRMESDALGRALDTLGWTGPVDIVAWSYGAAITLDFALGRPDRVRSLTLIEPPAAWLLDDADRDDPEVRRLAALGGELTGDVTADDLERFLNAVALVPPGARPRELPQWPNWFEHRRSLRNTSAPFEHRDDKARLSGFGAPVLLVTGDGTAPFLRRIHDTLAAALPAARTLELPGGHAPQLAAADAFLEALEAFLRQVQR
jgi:pimeloyl-ACP methyl ester carboxylesterase